MSWKQVNFSDVNTFDIFSFVNLKQNLIITGRVVTAFDSMVKIAVMSTDGVVRGMVDMPSWAKESTGDTVLKALYEAVDALPGSDITNKMWNVQQGNCSTAQLQDVIAVVSEKAFSKPECVILKFIPNLEITDAMLEKFEL